MRVEVVYALPRKVASISVELVEGATVGDALELARQSPVGSEFPSERGPVSVWGEVVDLDRRLRDDDRVELLRPLEQSPLEWRRKRLTRTGGQDSSDSGAS